MTAFIEQGTVGCLLPAGLFCSDVVASLKVSFFFYLLLFFATSIKDPPPYALKNPPKMADKANLII